MSPPMSLLRLWLTATGLFVAGFFIWVYVPVVVPLLAITAGLALFTAVVVSGTRALERWMIRNGYKREE